MIEIPSLEGNALRDGFEPGIEHLNVNGAFSGMTLK